MLSKLLLLLVPLAGAAPIGDLQQRDSPPSVTIRDGTVVGSSSVGIDTFNGIPFAQPPTGTLRLAPPQALSSPFGTLTATGLPQACPQFYSQVNTSDLVSDAIGYITDSPFFQQITNESEDCLTLNVQRPAGTDASAKLPVVFWIFGGGFEFGSTQLYDATQLILQSVVLGQPVMYVAANYRTGGFGFLGGKELAQEHSTNLGLRDQRLALQWVQDNIASFGGDPTKVTIWGESAGSISAYDQTIINGGDISYNGGQLFRGAIMDSGSLVPAQDVTSQTAQNIYDQVVSTSGCSGSSDTVACLRALPYAQFLAAANSVPGIFSYRSVDLSYVPRPDPGDNFYPVSPDQATQQADVPIIIGDQEDEGTLFALSTFNISTTEDLANYLSTYFPLASNQQVQDFVNLYPDDPAQGAPFGTGADYEIYPQFKRLAAILGDATFTLTRRIYLSQKCTGSTPCWSYLASYFDDVPILGTFHASDLAEIFTDLPLPEPALAIRTYYIAFINSLNPNSITTDSPLVNWPQWTNDSPNLVQFNAKSNEIIQDTFRDDASQYLKQNIKSFYI